MKLRTIITIGLLAAVGTHQAFAQEGKSRAEVRAELDEAIRTGNILAAGELALPLNQLRPDLYPSVAREPGKSREEVKAELNEAIRTGDILAAGDTSYKLNEAFPNLYPPMPVVAGKTREDAKAELAEAIRTGDILAGGELSLKRNQLYPWTYHGATSGMASSGTNTAGKEIFSHHF